MARPGRTSGVYQNSGSYVIVPPKKMYWPMNTASQASEPTTRRTQRSGYGVQAKKRQAQLARKRGLYGF
jgi:hypothetical protein